MSAMPMDSIPTPSFSMSTLEQLLREPSVLLDDINNERGVVEVSRVMLGTIAVTGAIFGAALGAYHGGIQILYAALKLPLVILLTACVCAPVLTMSNRALGRSASLSRDIAMVLSTLALGGLVIAALAPILLLAGLLKMSYHEAILVAFGSCGLGGLVGLSLLWRGLRGEKDSLWAALFVIGAFTVCGMQMSWVFRPYLVRPKTVEVPFMRELEGNIVESMMKTQRSARGLYDERDDIQEGYESDTPRSRLLGF
jgi:hypothetical protein